MARHCHVAALVRDTCVCMCACARVCARMRVRVINGLKYPSWIYANTFNSYTLYMRLNINIYSMWDYLCLFLVTGDVVQQETSDRTIKSRLSDATYSRGYVAPSD